MRYFSDSLFAADALHGIDVLEKRLERIESELRLGKWVLSVDNITLNSGTGGATLATDDVSGTHFQRIKLVDGTLDSSTAIASGGGVESGALRVTLANDSTGLVSVDDNGSSLTIDNAALSVTGSGVEASALRVTIATDSTGVLSIDDNGGSLTVDGTVTANLAAGTNNIGDVDVLTLPATALAGGTLVTVDYDTGAGTQNMPMVGLSLPASGGAVAGGTSTNPFRVDPTGTTAQPITDNGGSLTVDNAALSVVGGGTEATAQRVTIANDSTGVLSVDDNGASLTIDNAALSVTGGGVEASALRVTIANDSTGVLSIDDNGGSLTVDGTVTANAGTGTFAVGGVAAHDAAVSGNPVLLAGRANLNEPTEVSADGDVTTLWTDRKGALVIAGKFPANVASTTHGPNTSTLSTTSETTIVTGVASNSIFVTAISSSNTSATKSRVDFRDGTAGTIRISMMLAADGGGFVQQFDPPWKLTAAANLTAQLGTAVTDVRINVHYFIAP